MPDSGRFSRRGLSPVTENPHQSAPSTAAPWSQPPRESPELLLHGSSGLPPLPPAGAAAAPRGAAHLHPACGADPAASVGRPAPSPLQAPPRSAYLHIPFCHRRCFYCDFPVVPLGDRADGASGPGAASIAAYLELLHREIARSPAGPPLSTVYLGGGTPSMLTPNQVGGLLEALARRFGLAPAAEISLEMDPASFDRPRLAGYLAAGVNRVSLGGQSFDDAVLASLGRRHRRADLLKAAGWLERARRAGELRSWSLDLIQGVPLAGGAAPGGQPAAGSFPPRQEVLRHWKSDLAQAIAVGPPHLSLYDLIVEPGTVFERLQRQGALPLPDEDTSADLMEISQRRLAAAGYGHYEVSNYALPGHASRHNRVYWSGAGWWGFGLGATAAPWGERLARPRTRQAYADWLAASEAGEGLPGAWAAVALGAGASPAFSSGMPFDEFLLVGLRRREGVNLEALAAAYQVRQEDLADLRDRLQPFEREGLLRIEGPRWRLSDPEGLALSNGVLRECLAWWERAGCRSSRAEPRSPDPAHPSEEARRGVGGG
jgi:coproporphyrinogen III oxidase-like Fe-S oxidoreductase